MSVLFKTVAGPDAMLSGMTTHLPADQPARADQLLATLGDELTGRLVLPDDADWDRARQSWNLSIDQRPAAVVEAVSVQDIQATVRAARAAGLRVAPQATGHGSEALGPLDGAILLKTSGLRDVTIDHAGSTARLGAGVPAGEAADAAGAHGLAPVLGLAAGVGVVGLTLAGGNGFLSRRYGLASNNVRSLDVVLASGESRRVSAHADPDLFWALRGGGGRFAIVTAVELDLHPVPAVSAGMLAWPAERAGEVLEQFRRWTSDVPESLGAVFRYLSLPPVEAVPAPLRGRRIVAIVAAHLGSEADGRRLMEPLRGSRDTLVDTFGPIAPADLVRVAGDPEQPLPTAGEGFLIEDLTVDAVATVAELVATDALAPLGVLELRLLGGALGRRSEGHGALAALAGRFAVFAGGAAPDAAGRAAVDERLGDLRGRLSRWVAPQVMLGGSRFGVDPAEAFDEATWQRLGEIRDAVDPEPLILSNHDV
jgi:hypothetical protein